jgi:outer membrane immunogenic protein
MRSLNFAAFGAIAIQCIGAANAADVPYSYGGDQSYAAPQETWSGFYVGGLVGYGFGDASGFEPDGFLGGITAGINYQVDQFLLGAETDITAAGIGEEGDPSFEMDWVGTVRGRIGFAFDRFVVFGTGGFAWTNAEADIGGVNDSNFHGGWTAGAGIEAAITGNISAKAEYLFMDFTDELYAGVGTIDPELHTFRIGVNYKF